MPSKPAASKPKETKRCKDLRKRLAHIAGEIDAVQSKMVEDPANMTLSLELAGLNELKWSTMGSIETERGETSRALDCARQESTWANQKSRTAKNVKVDLLRDLTSRMERQEEARKAFREDMQRRSSHASG
jgi:hypothetical protein